MDEKDYPEVYLEECKYEIKKKKMNRYTDVELDLDVSDNCVQLLTRGRFILVNPKHKIQINLAQL